MTMIRIGTDDYPLVSAYNCRTCQSQHRTFIENQLILGRSYRAIRREIEKLEVGVLPHPSIEGLSLHVRNGHMPMPAQTRRRIIERRAEQVGSTLENEDDLVDYITVNEMILRRGWERMMSGEIEPNMNDLAQAIAMRAKIEATSTEGYDAEVWQGTLMAYMEVAQRFIPPEVFQQYGRELSKHPIMKAIAARQDDQRTVPGEVKTPQDE
jgi:hypothetical protein